MSSCNSKTISVYSILSSYTTSWGRNREIKIYCTQWKKKLYRCF